MDLVHTSNTHAGFGGGGRYGLQLLASDSHAHSDGSAESPQHHRDAGSTAYWNCWQQLSVAAEQHQLPPYGTHPQHPPSIFNVDHWHDSPGQHSDTAVQSPPSRPNSAPEWDSSYFGWVQFVFHTIFWILYYNKI